MSEFVDGAEKTLEIAKIIGVEIVILQLRTPSCGLVVMDLYMMENLKVI